MNHATRTAAIVAAAGCLTLGGALGSGLLTAGAATSTSTTTTTAPSGAPHGSNENPAHEADESAAREAAENNGTAGFGHCHHGTGRGNSGDATTAAPAAPPAAVPSTGDTGV